MRFKKSKLNKFKKRVDEWLLHHKDGDCSGTAQFTEGWVQEEGGNNPLKSLYCFESTGIKLPTNDLKTLEKYLQAKACMDLNIRNWAEDRAKGWLGKIEFRKIINELGYSEWVFNAVENQKVKFY